MEAVPERQEAPSKSGVRRRKAGRMDRARGVRRRVRRFDCAHQHAAPSSSQSRRLRSFRTVRALTAQCLAQYAPARNYAAGLCLRFPRVAYYEYEQTKDSHNCMRLSGASRQSLASWSNEA
jgi:hypothetical protein